LALDFQCVHAAREGVDERPLLFQPLLVVALDVRLLPLVRTICGLRRAQCPHTAAPDGKCPQRARPPGNIERASEALNLVTEFTRVRKEGLSKIRAYFTRP
jgi:hypothetical protein